MIPTLIVGIGAGLVATMLYASIAMGTGLSMLLFYLAPLPIFIACFGWGTLSGAIAALTAIATAALTLPGFAASAMMAATVALPPLWLSHLALLSRPVAAAGGEADTGADEAREWYPLGRLIVWTAGISIVLVAITIFMVAPDAESFRKTLGEMLKRFLEAPGAAEAMKDVPEDAIERFIGFMVWVLPAASAVIYLLTSLMNMWLAARAVSVSGRLTRPEPAYGEFDLPGLLAPALAASLVGGFLPGYLGIVAGIAAACLVVVYALLGLATVHAISRPLPLRPMLLATVYLSLFIFNWIIALLLAGLGLAETLFNIRARAAARAATGGNPPGGTT